MRCGLNCSLLRCGLLRGSAIRTRLLPCYRRRIVFPSRKRRCRSCRLLDKLRRLPSLLSRCLLSRCLLRRCLLRCGLLCRCTFCRALGRCFVRDPLTLRNRRTLRISTTLRLCNSCRLCCSRRFSALLLCRRLRTRLCEVLLRTRRVDVKRSRCFRRRLTCLSYARSTLTTLNSRKRRRWRRGTLYKCLSLRFHRLCTSLLLCQQLRRTDTLRFHLLLRCRPYRCRLTLRFRTLRVQRRLTTGLLFSRGTLRCLQLSRTLRG